MIARWLLSLFRLPEGGQRRHAYPINRNTSPWKTWDPRRRYGRR